MIAQIFSFSPIGSFQNPIWHVGAKAEVFDSLTSLEHINEPTLIPLDTLSEDQLLELSKFHFLARKHIQIQLDLTQIHQLDTIIKLNLNTQIWIDQPLLTHQIEYLKKFQEQIELIIVPIGRFRYESELEKILKLRLFQCRTLIIPKKSIHDSIPSMDHYFFHFQKLEKLQFPFSTLIIKNHLLESKVPMQNLMLNWNQHNMLRYAQSTGSTPFFLISLSQVFNTITFNYFSDTLLTLMKPTEPVLFKSVYHDFRQFYLFLKDRFLRNEWKVRVSIWKFLVSILSILAKFYFLILLRLYHYIKLQALPSLIHFLIFAFSFLNHHLKVFLLKISWPLQKVYWVLKFQFEKRLLGRHKNEV